MIRIARCPKCKNAFMGCWVGAEDSETIRDFQRYESLGFEILEVEKVDLKRCECKKDK